jgi:hypothetical protein
VVKFIAVAPLLFFNPTIFKFFSKNKFKILLKIDDDSSTSIFRKEPNNLKTVKNLKMLVVFRRLEKQLKLGSAVLKKLREPSTKQQKCYYSPKTTQSSPQKKHVNDSASFANNSIELSVKASKRLMRLVYARVHPDLFTNDRLAQVT